MQSNDDLQHGNNSLYQGKIALQDHCLALQQSITQIGTLLEEKEHETERIRREEEIWLAGGTAPCTHPDCPITTPHNNGRYLHNNRPSRWSCVYYISSQETNSSDEHPRWGTCNPPPSVWQGQRRINRGTEDQSDVDICDGFVAAHAADFDVGDSDGEDSHDGDSNDEGSGHEDNGDGDDDDEHRHQHWIHPRSQFLSPLSTSSRKYYP